METKYNITETKLVGIGHGKQLDAPFMRQLRVQQARQGQACETIIQKYTFDCLSCSESCRNPKCMNCFTCEDHTGHWWVAEKHSGEVCSNVLLQNPFAEMSKADFIKVFQQVDIIVQSVLKKKAVDLAFFNNSPVLTRALAIYLLRCSDNVTVEQLFRNQNDFDKLMQADKAAAQKGMFQKMSFFMQLLEIDGRQSERIVKEILPMDHFYRCAVLRQLIPNLNKILNTPKSELIPLALQSAYSREHALAWGFYEGIAQHLQAEIEVFVITKNMERFENFVTLIKSLTFVKDTELPLQFVKAVAACENSVLNLGVNPDTKVDHANKILIPLKCGQVYAKSIQRGLIQARASPESLAKSIGNYQLQVHLFSFTPAVIFPALFINSARASQLGFKQFMESVREISNLTTQQFVQRTTQQLIHQQITQIYCQLNQEYAQNLDDINSFVNILNSAIDLKLMNLIGYYFTQQMLLAYPAEVSQLASSALQSYIKTPQVEVHFAAVLEHLAPPCFDEATLGRLIYEVQANPLDMKQFIQMKGEFTTAQFDAVIASHFRQMPSYDRFHSALMDLNNVDSFDPIYYSSAEKIIQERFQTSVPIEIKEPSYSAGVLACFPKVEARANETLDLFEDSVVGLSTALLCARILRQIGAKPRLNSFKSQQLNDLLIPKVEVEKATTKINMRDKMAMLRGKASVKQTLMTSADVQSVDEIKEGDTICNMCHGAIEGPCAVPAIVQICIYNNMELPYFCRHKYHLQCIKKLREETMLCACCNFPAHTWYEMQTPGKRTWIDEEARLLYYLFEQIDLEDPVAYNAVLKEIDKVRFMCQNAFDKDEFKRTNTEIARIKNEFYEHLHLSNEELFAHLRATVFSKVMHKDLVLDTSIFLPSTKHLIQRFSTAKCVKCGEGIEMEGKNPPIQCLGCQRVFHFACAVSDQNEFSCPNCRSRFAFHPVRLVIFRSHRNVIRAPYTNRFNQYDQNILDEEKLLRPELLNELKLILLCGHSHKFEDDLLLSLGFDGIYSKEETAVRLRRMDDMQFAGLLMAIQNDQRITEQERMQRIQHFIELRDGGENRARNEAEDAQLFERMVAELSIPDQIQFMEISEEHYNTIILALITADQYPQHLRTEMMERLRALRRLSQVFQNPETATEEQINALRQWASDTDNYPRQRIIQRFNAKLESIAARKAVEELRKQTEPEYELVRDAKDKNNVIENMKTLLQEGFDLDDVWGCVSGLPDDERMQVLTLLYQGNAIPELRPYVVRSLPKARVQGIHSPQQSPFLKQTKPEDAPLYRQEPLQPPGPDVGGEEFY